MTTPVVGRDKAAKLMLHVAKPQDLEHPDRPANDPEGAAVGRRIADEVVEQTLSPFRGEIPPPVGAVSGETHGSEEED